MADEHRQNARKTCGLGPEEKHAFGRRLRQVRGERTMSQMAELYQVSQSYWSKLESGTGADPSLLLVDFICVCERLSRRWLIHGQGPEPAAARAHPVTPEDLWDAQGRCRLLEGAAGPTACAMSRDLVSAAVAETLRLLQPRYEQTQAELGPDGPEKYLQVLRLIVLENMGLLDPEPHGDPVRR